MPGEISIQIDVSPGKGKNVVSVNCPSRHSCVNQYPKNCSPTRLLIELPDLARSSIAWQITQDVIL
jgi:hypothetical protein